MVSDPDFEQLSLFPGQTPQPETRETEAAQPALRQQWEAWLEDFQAWLGSKNRAAQTIRGYTTDLQQFFDYLEEHDALDPAALEGQHLVNWLAELQAEGAKGTTLDRKRTALKQFFRWLVEHKDYPYGNPSQVLAVPTQDYHLPPTLTAPEVTALLAAPDAETPQGRRDRAILGLLVGCGLRVSEVVTLRTDHITWGEAAQQGTKEAEEPATLYVSGRLVPLPPNVKRFLQEWLETHLGTPTPEVPHNVFDITTRQIRKLVLRYARQAGLHKHVNPSVLRHTCAVLRLAAGERYADVKRIMGHELDDIMVQYVERARNLQAIQAAHFDVPVSSKQ
jgi:site-specific recombinase XerD